MGNTPPIERQQQTESSPRFLLLGAAQDAGVPQIGCSCANCAAVWQGRAEAQAAVSAALIDDATRSFWLIDCGPDIKQQWHALGRHAPGCKLRGVLLTHMHMGHYIGLAQLGKEGMNVHGLQVAGTASVCAFLRGNQPWATGIRDGTFVLRELQPGRPHRLHPAAGLEATPVLVPHRAEYSDCVAYHVSGPTSTLLYLPDIDSWDAWDAAAGGEGEPRGWAVRAAVRGADTALLDACFFDAGELPPGRDPSTIPHPLIEDTLDVLKDLAAKVVLIHMNHTNPVWRDSEQRTRCLAGGFRLGWQGMELPL